jgi:AcrR family transcriptional regulator
LDTTDNPQSVRTGTDSEPAVSRENQLLTQAIELFSQSGYRETGLQEIADKLNITRPLFYYYFESKDDLLWRIIGQLGDQLLDRAKPIAASDLQPREKMAKLLEGHADTLLRNVHAFRIYFAERHNLDGPRHRRLLRGEKEYYDLLRSVIIEGQERNEFKPTDSAILARLVMGMGNSILRWYESGGPMARENVINTFAEAGVDALREH